MTKQREVNTDAEGRKFDPVLKEAMAEIGAILEKHKIGGCVLLGSQTHAEHLFKHPEWAVVQWEAVEVEGESGMGLRFRTKREDFQSSQEQHHFTEATASYFDIMQSHSLHAAAYHQRCLEMMKEAGLAVEQGDYSIFDANSHESSVN